MRKNLQYGASSVGGVIGIVIVILVLLLGAFYYWESKIQPRINQPPRPFTPSPQSSSTEIQINLDATTT